MNKGVTYRPELNGLESLAILQRIAIRDKSVISDCLDTYGNLIWALAKRYTSSTEEAEETVLQIFKEIWTCASQYDSGKGNEDEYILRIVFRCLIKQSSGRIYNKANCNRRSNQASSFLLPNI